MNAPCVSVVIATWNRSALLRECLASLRAQTFRDFEIIVVDNGSTDDSREMVAHEFPDVRLIALDTNHGFAGGNNVGIRAARGELIAVLNNDAAADSRWLQVLVEAMTDAGIGSVTSRVILYDQREWLDGAGDGFAITGNGFRRGYLQPASAFNRAEPVFGASGCAAIYRRALLDDIGLYDEDFFAVFEDVDLAFRARLAGYHTLYLPDAIVYHRGRSTLGSMSTEYVYLGRRNVEFVFWKDLPLPLLLLCFLPHLFFELAGLIYFASQGHGRAWYRAKRDAFKALPTLRQKRKQIQKQRRVSNLSLLRWFDWNLIGRTVNEKKKEKNRTAQPSHA